MPRARIVQYLIITPPEQRTVAPENVAPDLRVQSCALVHHDHVFVVLVVVNAQMLVISAFLSRY